MKICYNMFFQFIHLSFTILDKQIGLMSRLDKCEILMKEWNEKQRNLLICNPDEMYLEVDPKTKTRCGS